MLALLLLHAPSFRLQHPNRGIMTDAARMPNGGVHHEEHSIDALVARRKTLTDLMGESSRLRAGRTYFLVAAKWCVLVMTARMQIRVLTRIHLLYTRTGLAHCPSTWACQGMLPRGRKTRAHRHWRLSQSSHLAQSAIAHCSSALHRPR